jgi:hypothetical protein
LLLALAQNARRVLNREQLLALTHTESTEVFDRLPALCRLLAVGHVGGKDIAQAAQRFNQRRLMRVQLN